MPLTQEQLNKFRQLLEAEKKSVEEELAQLKNPQQHGLLTTAFPSLEQEAGSPDEGMEEVEAFEANLNIHQHLTHRSNEINKALEKISSGTYGFCENCKQEIPLERLEANPAATTCIRCKGFV